MLVIAQKTILINNNKVSQTQWGKVDKKQLKNILRRLQLEGIDVNDVIYECFGHVGNVYDPKTWKYPHHELIMLDSQTYELVINDNGVVTALRMIGWGALNDKERELLKMHLEQHLYSIKQRRQ